MCTRVFLSDRPVAWRNEPYVCPRLIVELGVHPGGTSNGMRCC